MITKAAYTLTYARWRAAPATLTEHDFDVLAEFGSTTATLGSEADRARAAYAKATALPPPAPPVAPPETSPLGELPDRLKGKKASYGALLHTATQFAALVKEDRARIATLESRVLELEATIALEKDRV